MTGPIITRQLSPYVSEQGPASELNRDRAQVAALGRIPNPMTSFEDTSDAYEAGYRDGWRKALEEAANLNGVEGYSNCVPRHRIRALKEPRT